MPNPPLFLPMEASPGQMYGSWATLMARFGYQFGQMLDHRMRKVYGRDWLEQVRAQRLERDRGFKATLHDPSFLLTEAPKRDSLCTRVMPPGFAWIDAFHTVRIRRNEWAHYKGEGTLDELEASAEELQELLQAIGLNAMPIGQDVAALLARIFDLRANGGAIPDPQMDELQSMLRESERQYGQAQKRLAELTGQLEYFAGRAADNKEERSNLLQQLRIAEQQAAQQRDEYERRLRSLEERQQTRHTQTLAPPAGLMPGDPWPAARGSRRFYLQKAPAVGLIDIDSGGFVGGDLEGAARAAAARWLKVMPLGGPIWVTDTWQAAGMIGLTLTYLGRLDEEPVQDETIGAPIASVLTPRGYKLATDGSIIDHRGRSLAQSLGAAEARRVVDRLSCGAALAREAVGLAPEVPLDLRITYDGVVAAPFADDERGFIGRVGAQEWFPGVVR